jgi:hypothetical protein
MTEQPSRRSWSGCSSRTRGHEAVLTSHARAATNTGLNPRPSPGPARRPQSRAVAAPDPLGCPCIAGTNDRQAERSALLAIAMRDKRASGRRTLASPFTNRQNSRLLRVGRVTLPLSAGRGYAEPRFRTATSISTTRALVSDCAESVHRGRSHSSTNRRTARDCSATTRLCAWLPRAHAVAAEEPVRLPVATAGLIRLVGALCERGGRDDPAAVSR